MTDHTNEEHGNDPEWKLIDPEWKLIDVAPGTGEMWIVVGPPGDTSVGVGAYNCDCCGEPSVMLALNGGGYQSHMRISPAAAMSVAAELMAALKRVGYTGGSAN
jgi:hypothetical protein